MHSINFHWEVWSRLFFLKRIPWVNNYLIGLIIIGEKRVIFQGRQFQIISNNGIIISTIICQWGYCQCLWAFGKWLLQGGCQLGFSDMNIQEATNESDMGQWFQSWMVKRRLQHLIRLCTMDVPSVPEDIKKLWDFNILRSTSKKGLAKGEALKVSRAATIM